MRRSAGRGGLSELTPRHCRFSSLRRVIGGRAQEAWFAEQVRFAVWQSVGALQARCRIPCRQIHRAAFRGRDVSRSDDAGRFMPERFPGYVEQQQVDALRSRAHGFADSLPASVARCRPRTIVVRLGFVVLPARLGVAGIRCASASARRNRRQRRTVPSDFRRQSETTVASLLADYAGNRSREARAVTKPQLLYWHSRENDDLELPHR